MACSATGKRVLITGVDGRVDLRPMLTHTFRLEQWRDAFLVLANQESGAVKVAIDQR
jgi:threonine dehydrogenase-like Zn-dependent dehydrogenase